MVDDRTRTFVIIGILLAVFPIAISVLMACIHRKRKMNKIQKATLPLHGPVEETEGRESMTVTVVHSEPLR